MRYRFAFYRSFVFSFSWMSIILLASGSLAHAQDAAGDYGNEKRAIERVLRKQQEAWNRHDLEGFMAGYWNSSKLTFFSSAKELDGWQATMDRYLATYGNPGREMGKLEFTNLKIEVLGQEAAFVRGSWRLTVSHGKLPQGLFTLIFRKFPEGWKIIHDHTSAEQPTPGG